MSRVDTDLESLISFREHLVRFNGTMDEEFHSMRSHWKALGDVWHDQKYEQFGAALDEAARGVDRYLAMTEDLDAYLLRLIEALRAYIEVRGISL